MSYDKRFLIGRISLIIIEIFCIIFLLFLIIALIFDINIDLNNGESIALIITLIFFILVILYFIIYTFKARYSKIIIYKDENKILQIYDKVFKEYIVNIELININIIDINKQYIKVRISFNNKIFIKTRTKKEDFYNEIKKSNLESSII